AKAGVVGKDTARHTKADSGPHGGASKATLLSGRVKGVAGDQIKSQWNSTGQDNQWVDENDDIRHRHKRHEFAGHSSSTTDAAQQHQSDQYGDNDAGNPGGHGKVGMQYIGHRV